MLYGYPVEATAENWLHDCLCEMIRSIHTRIAAIQPPLAWPDIIPEPYRERLRTRTGLRDRLIRYSEQLKILTPEERDRIFRALREQNRIPDLLSCMCDCESADQLPELIQETINDLFGFAFNLLTHIGSRDMQYKRIYHTAPHPVCPFCGCEYFDAPGAPREDLDHYLVRELYPFAAANLRNLVPMGNKCNSSYKLTQDILRRSDGTRRRSFDPYGNISIQISLDNSRPFEGVNELVPAWQIEFDMDIEEVTTWDEVFHIRERYKRDILDPLFNCWLRNFSSWCRAAIVEPISNEVLIDALKRFADYLGDRGIEDRAFLKAAVFRMLHRHCVLGNERLISFIHDLLTTMNVRPHKLKIFMPRYLKGV